MQKLIDKGVSCAQNFSTQHSALSTQHSALSTQHSALRRILLSLKDTNSTFGKNTLYLIIAFLCAIVFCLIYGVRILCPTYTDWLMVGGDLSQHYLGWQAYRLSDWHFPIGLVDNLAYPSKTSIIFTDSIPLFAVFFKIFSPLLPHNFQYFGLWGIFCFMLQGVFAARILRKYVQQNSIIIIISVLFAFVPVVLQRMFMHTALAANWLLLYSLDILFNHQKYANTKRICITAAIMGALCSAIHLYFLPMCAFILAGYVLYDFLNSQQKKKYFIQKNLCVLICFVFAVLAVTALLGGFSSSARGASGGLGYYSLNLNAFYNPQGYSSLFRDFSCGSGQYEGLVYLGAGFIFLLVISIAFFANSPKAKTQLCNNYKLLISLVAVCLVSLVFALSPVVTFYGVQLFTIPCPEFITNLWSVFRSSGRIAWVMMYIMMLCSVIVLVKASTKKLAIVLCLCAFFVQCFDLRFVLIDKYGYFSTKQTYQSLLQTNSFWEKIAKNKNIKHLVYYSITPQAMMYSLTDFALKNDKTVSNYYFSRVNVSAENHKKAFAELADDTLFIFNKEEKSVCKKFKLHYYLVDDVILGSVNAIDGFSELKLEELGE